MVHPKRAQKVDGTTLQAVSSEAALLRLEPSIGSCGDREKKHGALHRK
jgi:hypothetical protein